MSVVKINALEIPPQAGEAMVERFKARMDSVAGVAGFEGFELLRPTGESETRWFVYTRWADDASYEGWRDGEGAKAAHASDDGTPQRPPASMGSALLEFEVELSV